MLQAIECAVEFWLALEWSPQAQWLLEASETGPLQEEVEPWVPQGLAPGCRVRVAQMYCRLSCLSERFAALK